MFAFPAPCCAACRSPFGAVNKPIQLHCAHLVCLECQEDMIHKAEQTVCPVCLQDAFPSAVNHALLAFLCPGETRDKEETRDEEEDARPLKRSCGLPSEAPAESLAAWQAHLDALHAAAAQYQRDVAAEEALLQEEYDQKIQLMKEEQAKQLEERLCDKNRAVSSVRVQSWAGMKEYDLAISSADAHLGHLGLPSSVLAAIPGTIPAPPVKVPAVSPVGFTIMCTEERYCAVVPGHSDAHCKRETIFRFYPDRATADLISARLYLACLWDYYGPRIGTLACIKSPFASLDRMEAMLTPAQIHACIVPALISKVQDLRFVVLGESDTDVRAFLMAPASMSEGLATKPNVVDLTLIAGLPVYDPSLKPEYLPIDHCFCGTPECGAPLLPI